MQTTTKPGKASKFALIIHKIIPFFFFNQLTFFSVFFAFISFYPVDSNHFTLHEFSCNLYNKMNQRKKNQQKMKRDEKKSYAVKIRRNNHRNAVVTLRD